MIAIALVLLVLSFLLTYFMTKLIEHILNIIETKSINDKIEKKEQLEKLYNNITHSPYKGFNPTDESRKELNELISSLEQGKAFTLKQKKTI